MTKVTAAVTQEDKLKTLIELAVSRGWEGKWKTWASKKLFRMTEEDSVKLIHTWCHGAIRDGDIEHVIFSHDFAKAVYGEERMCDFETEEPHLLKDCRCEYERSYEAWEHFLMRQVLSEDPLSYMFEHRKV